MNTIMYEFHSCFLGSAMDGLAKGVIGGIFTLMLPALFYVGHQLLNLARGKKSRKIRAKKLIRDQVEHEKFLFDHEDQKNRFYEQIEEQNARTEIAREQIRLLHPKPRPRTK
jgi:hypothetical protein